MKTKILNLSLFAFFMLLAITMNAQMQKPVFENYTEGEYEKCMKFCDRYDNSAEKQICMAGCASNGSISVSIKAINQAISLLPEINSQQLKEGENLFYTDKKTGLRYFAILSKGSLIGYQIKNSEGYNIPSPLISLQKEGNKRCFMINPDGTLREVKCPDIIIIGYPVTRYY